jgi:PAS domain S-box-containing protein
MKLNSLTKKIGAGFFLMVILLMLITGITYWQVSQVHKINERIRTLRTPTVQSSLMMLNVINHSLAALRGWIIVGETRFKQERNKAWDNEIITSLNSLQDHSKNWTNPANKERLKKIQSKLKEFENFQQEIENISHTLSNTPATKILVEQAIPAAHEVMNAISQMLDLEKGLKANGERKELLGIMADFRVSMALGLSSIRAYLLTGDEKFKRKFENDWVTNSQRFVEMNERYALFSVDQKTTFDDLTQSLIVLEPLPSRMFEIQKGGEYDISKFLLATKAAPIAFEIKSIAQEMMADQQKLMKEDLLQTERADDFLFNIMAFLLILGIFAGAFVGVALTRSIKRSLEQTIEVAEAIAGGNYHKEINIRGGKELKALAGAMKHMQDNIIASINSVEEKENRIASIVDGAGAGIVVINPHGIVQNFNKKAQDLFGYSSGEVVGNNVTMLMPSPYSQEHDKYLKKYMETGLSKIIGVGRELEAKKKNGDLVPIFLSINRVETSIEPIFVGVLDNLTEVKKSQKAEKESRELLIAEKATLEQEEWIKSSLVKISRQLQGLPDLKTLASGLMNELTPAVEASLGALYLNNNEGTELSLIGSYAYTERKNVSDRLKIGQGLVGQCALEMKPILLTSVPEEYIRVASGLGESSPKDIMVLPVVYENKLEAVIEIASLNKFTPSQKELLNQVAANLGVIIENLEGRIKTERLLKESQLLAQKNQEQSEELRSQQEELEESNQELYSFASMAAHDLKAPLRHIGTFSGILQDYFEEKFGDEENKYFGKIDKALGNMNDLIQDLLSYAKLTSEDQPFEHVDLNHIVTNVIEDLEGIIQEKKGEINVGGMPTIEAIPVHMRQILQNLISNSIKYHRENVPPVVKISCLMPGNNGDQQNLDTDFCQIIVQDNGIGFDEGQTEKVFSPFGRLHGKNKFEGSGLGLATVKKIIDLYKGEISVKSKVCEGSTFIISLPLKQEANNNSFRHP